MRAPVVTFKRARALRRTLSLPEVILWRALRGRTTAGLRFRRQHPMGPYIIDFFCPAARLAVEVDGAAHDHPEQAEHDARRDAWLARQGVSLLRFPAGDILDEKRLEGVLLAIGQAAAPSTTFGGPPPPLRGGGTTSNTVPGTQ
jgi:very-short-patch-repair endonuclease